MEYKKFDWHSWLVASCSGGLFFLLACSICFSPSLSLLELGTLEVAKVFCFDGVSFYLIILSCFLWLSLLFFISRMSGVSKFMIGVSVFSSLASYCCINSLVFWVFYELSILPLLLLLVLESPYSERYIASWYLLGYVVLTSLPMLLCIFYISLGLGSFNMIRWSLGESVTPVVLVLLGIMFVTKIPLPPFHVWLPIVHAEASSSVSVCLSGYIMKLGVLGVCRFCFWVLPESLFGDFYMLVVLGLACLFFFNSCRELDGKRWLAFLSLSHILIAAVCLSVSSWDLSGVAFLFCLGHGLSAGVIFILLWVIYEVCGSRNWAILKFCLPSSLFIRVLCGVCLCTAGSLPPTIQFFSEIFVIMDSGFVSGLYLFVFFLYMFMSGLVPLFVLGSLLTRHFSVGFGSNHVFGLFGSVSFLGVWSFLLFLVC